MRPPFSPITSKAFKADIHYHVLKESPLEILGCKISWIKRHHPGGCFAYRVEKDGKSLVFSPDTELVPSNFKRTRKNIDFFEGVDALILDGQYRPSELAAKKGWGHSSYLQAVDFALVFHAKKLFLFHHDLFRCENELEQNLQDAKKHGLKVSASFLCDLAREHKNIQI